MTDSLTWPRPFALRYATQDKRNDGQYCLGRQAGWPPSLGRRPGKQKHVVIGARTLCKIRGSEGGWGYQPRRSGRALVGCESERHEF